MKGETLVVMNPILFSNKLTVRSKLSVNILEILCVKLQIFIGIEQEIYINLFLKLVNQVSSYQIRNVINLWLMFTKVLIVI